MNRSQKNNALAINSKRQSNIICLTILIIGIFLASLFFLFLYFKSAEEKYVYYEEKSNVDYNVYLKQNDFYKEDYLIKGRKYVSSLIDFIDAQYNYSMEIKDYKSAYKYKYKIIALMEVSEKNSSNNIYDFTETLFESDEYTSNSNRLLINKNIRIDYNKYNQIAERFVNWYELENTNSNLKIILSLDITSDCLEFDNSKGNTSVTLNIPLNTKTFNIDYITNIANKDNQKFLLCSTQNKAYLLFIGIALIPFNLFIIVYLIDYIKRTRTLKTKYQQQLKKILNNYSPYIQKTSNQFKINHYEIVKIESFNDMLEIRDTINQPILMIENKEETSTFFMIPSNTNLLYVYKLDIEDVKGSQDEESK